LSDTDMFALIQILTQLDRKTPDVI